MLDTTLYIVIYTFVLSMSVTLTFETRDVTLISTQTHFTLVHTQYKLVVAFKYFVKDPNVSELSMYFKTEWACFLITNYTMYMVVCSDSPMGFCVKNVMM